MTTQDLKTIEREIIERIERLNSDLDWLVADTANKYPQSNPSPNNQNEAAKSSTKLPFPTHQKKSLLKLSPEEFKERYQKEGNKFAEAFYLELVNESKPTQAPQQPPQQYTFINIPPKYSSEEIMKRVKDGESLEKILNDHKE